MSNQSPPVRRSWTAEEEGGSSKWPVFLLLIVLLAVGVYFLIKSLSWTTHPKVFLATFSVAEYNTQVLPEPAYANWNTDQALSTFEAQGVNRWTALEHSDMTSMADLRGEWATLRKELENQGASPQDTLVVYVRTNALAIAGDVYLLSNDFSRRDLEPLGTAEPGEQVELSNATSFSAVLADLQELPVANIVVFADFCDFIALPKLGIMVNDVPATLDSSTKALAGETPLWVVTSCSSFQPAHISVKKNSTLLQAACEYACSSSTAAKSQDFVSLANLYETIVRFSNDVTDASQTPLLFRSGFGSMLSGNEMASAPWSEALQVSVGRVERNADADNLEQEESPEDTTEPASNSVSGATADDESSEPELTPSLEFWSLHDRLGSRDEELGGWSPVDFAIQNWKQLEREAAFHSRKTRLQGLQASAELENLRKRLENLESKIAAGNPLASGERARLAWTTPEILAPDLREPWVEARRGYRTYFNAMGRLAGWLELALVEPQGPRSRLLSYVEEQIATLAKIDAYLPVQESESILENRLPRPLLDKLQSTSLEIESYTSERIADLVEAIAQAKLPEGDKLTWALETQINHLLASTVIPYQQRKKLAFAFGELDGNHVVQPGVNASHVDQQKSVGEIISISTKDRSPDYFLDWSSAVSRALLLAGTNFLNYEAGDSAVVNDWGIKVGQRLQSKIDGEDEPAPNSLQSWKMACIVDLIGARIDAQQIADGLLLPASDDLGLFVDVNRQQIELISNTNELNLDVSHRNGESAIQCWFGYVIENLGDPSTDKEVQVSIRGRDERLLMGELQRVRIVRGQLPLNIRLAGEDKQQTQSEPIRRMKLRLTADRGKPGVETTIDLLPPRPNHVSLVAKQVDLKGNIVASVASARTENGWHLKQLEVPAIGQQSAAAQYEIHVVNRSSTEKLVRVKLYPVQQRGGMAGSGRVTTAAMALTNNRRSELVPLLTSAGPIRLEAANNSVSAIDSSDSSKRVSLVASTLSDGKMQSSAGEFGLLCVIEEMRQQEEGEPVPTGVEWVHWIDCVPQNPAGNLVTVQPQEAAREFSLRFSLTPKALSNWQVAGVSIDGFVTTAQGHLIPVLGESSVALTKEEPVKTLSLRPDWASSQSILSGSQDKLFAHISIEGYPRAVTYESRLRGASLSGSGATVAIQPFVWIDSNAISLSPVDSANNERVPLKVWPGRETRVVPTQIGSNESSNGQRAEYASLVVPARIDFPPGGKSEVTFTLNSSRTTYSVDRKFLPRLNAVGGNLLFSASMGEIVHEFSNVNNLRGKQTLEVSLQSQYRDVSREVDVVFDRAPPRESRIRLDQRTLYLNEALNITLETPTENGNADTPLVPSQVYFAIDQTRFGAGKYDAGDELLNLKVQSPSGRLTAVLKAEQLASFARGEYRIVARTIDFAGNVQDANVAARFNWIPTKRPVAQPREEPAQQPPPKQVPKKHTVQVKVTLAGKSLTAAQYRGTEVTGISAPVKSYTQGVWVYTLVPEGGYKVKATLKANGKKYEGNADITVNSSKSISIALKPAS